MKTKFIKLKDLKETNTKIYNKVMKWLKSLTPELDYENGNKFAKWIKRNLELEEPFSIFVLLEENNEIIGVVSILSDDQGVGKEYSLEGIWIAGFNIKRENRGKGYGNVLMKCLDNYFSKITDKGIKVNLFTSNPIALNLYEKFGFKKINGLKIIRDNKECVVCVKNYGKNKNLNQNKDNSHSNKIYKKKLSSGFEIPVLGIGTYTFGGEHEADYSRDKEWISAIKTALNLGYTHIDTAEIYGSGHTEELVGKAIEGYEREKLFITTKVYKTNLRYDDVLKSAQESLKRMKINYIDLYLIHSFNPDIPLKETVLAMNKLVEKGLVRYIGVCNFSVPQLKEAQKHSKVKIIVNQMKYKIWSEIKKDSGVKQPDTKTFEYCQKNSIMITTYKIFGRGKIKTDKIPLILEIAKKYNKTDAQIIINWIASKKNFVIIFMSMNKNHLKENIDALNFNIDKEDIQKLDDSFLK